MSYFKLESMSFKNSPTLEIRCSTGKISSYTTFAETKIYHQINALFTEYK